MSTISMLDSKIEELNNGLEEFNQNNENIKSEIGTKLAQIEDALNATRNEDILLNFNFNKAIALLKEYELSIANLEKNIADIKVAIEVKKELEMDMPFSERQKAALVELEDNLNKIKDKLNLKIEELEVSMDRSKKIEELEELREVLTDESGKKYVTTDMVSALYEVYDILNASPLSMQELLEGMYDTRNLRVRDKKGKVDFDKVVELYKSYLSERDMKVFERLLKAHESEVVSVIDLDNTKDILDFLKNEDLLEKFRRTALLKVTLYAKNSYVKEVYNKMKEQSPECMDIYFEDDLSSVWICDNRDYKKRPFRTSRKPSKTKKEDKMYTECHSLTFEEFWENVRLLNENKEMFSDKYDVANFGAHLRAKTVPTEELKKYNELMNLIVASSWSFKKNIGLLKLFGLGTVNKIPVSTFEHGNIEDKLHLAVELGLLNPPMNAEFLEMEKSIPLSDKLKTTEKAKGDKNPSVRNYYGRYLTKLSLATINEFAYMFRKMDFMGKKDFYTDFFSTEYAGKNALDFFTPEERSIIADKDKMDELVSECFTNEWYQKYINNFDEYSSEIDKFNNVEKKFKLDRDYYDESILSEELIQKLESEHSIKDITPDGEEKNEFVYLFGDKIISRLKVLHNASILKGIYGHVDEDMLLTSIVRNSYLNDEAFKLIESSVKGKGVTL